MLLSLPPPVMLSLAIMLEVAATSLLPKTQQFTSLPATAAVLIGYGCAFELLSALFRNSVELNLEPTS